MTSSRREGGRRLTSRGLVFLAVAGTLVVAGIAAFVGSAFISADTDRDGRVPVPGAATLELEPGEVDLFYAEDVDLGENESLSAPPDLAVAIVDPAGAPVEVRVRSGQEVSGNRGTATLIGSIDVVEGGPYEVVTESSLAASRPTPEVTLGESPFDLIGERLGEVGDAVIGPVGLVALALLLLLVAVLALRGRASESGPTLPPGHGDMGQ